MSNLISSATERKREALRNFIDRHIGPHDGIKAVIVYGSVANGTAVASSDVDALVFMEPVDHFLVPAEATWSPRDDSFRSIFDGALFEDDLQLDFMRVSWSEWSSEGFRCPEDVRGKLDSTWIAFVRPGYEVQEIIRRVTSMSDQEQQEQLDAALLDLDGLSDDSQSDWKRSHVEALDSLNMAWEAILRGIYAVNRTWFPFRGRAVRNLALLPWNCGLTGDLLLACVSGPTDHAGYVARFAAISAAKRRLIEHVQGSAHYGEDPVFSAFLRKYDEPGRAWNMDEWNQRNRRDDKGNVLRLRADFV